MDQLSTPCVLQKYVRFQIFCSCDRRVRCGKRSPGCRNVCTRNSGATQRERRERGESNLSNRSRVIRHQNTAHSLKYYDWSALFVMILICNDFVPFVLTVWMTHFLIHFNETTDVTQHGSCSEGLRWKSWPWFNFCSHAMFSGSTIPSKYM